MAGKLKKKGKVGAKASHISRNQALRRLQLSLANFRRLCIYKGVFPRELKGKTVFHKKDITYLMHDPLITFFRLERVYRKKLQKASAKKDFLAKDELLKNKPTLNLDHVIKERYPTFDDALKDLTDALCFLFTIAEFPSVKYISTELVEDSARLTTEFLNYVIASKSLTKVFISVKGYYFQAQIEGLPITWIIPHKLVPKIPSDVDFKILKSFAEFYITIVGFVNCHLFNVLNIIYPPKILGGILRHRTAPMSNDELCRQLLSSLTLPLTSSDRPNPPTSDTFTEITDDTGVVTYTDISALFAGKKFFLSREVPKQPFVFAIKCSGGDVAWVDDCSLGVLFKEDDSSITHHILDRPAPKELQLGRVYLQPQWIFDSINSCSCLSYDHYLPEATLPAHTSPFVSHKYQHLFEKLEKDVARLEDQDTHDPEPKNEMTEEHKKMAYLSLPNKKRKLYDKLVKIRKSRLKEETKLQRKRKLIAMKAKAASS